MRTPLAPVDPASATKSYQKPRACSAPATPAKRPDELFRLVGTPKGRLTRLEKALVATPWQDARPGVQVKLLPQDGELYVFAQSADRVAKERSMRRRQLKWLWGRLKQLANMKPPARSC